MGFKGLGFRIKGFRILESGVSSVKAEERLGYGLAVPSSRVGNL